MAMKPLPDQATLQQLLDYDPAIGRLVWKVRAAHLFSGRDLSRSHAAAIWNGKFAGKVALNTQSPSGYLFGQLGNTTFQAHRVIWKLVTGEEPVIIDHINGNKRDNRIVNLRNVTSELNARNMPKLRNNTSGHTGVHYCRATGRWRAEMTAGKRHIRIGRFDTLEAAVAARREAALAHGFHENHGR